MSEQKHKTHFTIFFIVIVLFLILLILWNLNFGRDQDTLWGVTFSKPQAEWLDLDWLQVYGTMVDEINFKTIRLPIYWPDVETNPGQFDFSSYDWMITKAAQKGIEIMPVIGRRVPRWPECHVPKFYQNLSEAELQQKIFNLLEKEINHFKQFDNIKKWQLDNEPYADFFGDCPKGDKNLVDEEIKILREIDNRPIVITEAGELSTWLQGAKQADILGVSMYRMTWSEKSGWFYYPIPAAYYYLKAQIVKLLTNVKQIINTELQVEPWAKQTDIKQMDLFDQLYAMDLDQVKENIKFADRAGLSENYLWGVEWWYWMGKEHGHWEYWNFAKEFFK